MELSSYPEITQQDYHRLSGLHYTSSFSDADDCCDETTSTSSSSDYLGMGDWQAGIHGIIYVLLLVLEKPVGDKETWIVNSLLGKKDYVHTELSSLACPDH